MYTMNLCQMCSQEIDPKLFATYCGSDCIERASAASEDLAGQLKREVTGIIRWADANKSRSLQVEIGPSDLGSECDRQIGYILAQFPKINRGHTYDPWAAIVGTAIHEWLDTAVTNFSTVHGRSDWKTEQELRIDDIIVGHSDLYWRERSMVIDWKSMNQEKMKAAREAGFAAFPKHAIQAHLYGYGYSRLKYPVLSVALVCLPRSGRLRDAVVLCEPYDARIAHASIARMYEIIDLLVTSNVYADPAGIDKITAKSGDHCGLCPWYDPDRLDGTADASGCPGRA